MQFLKKLGEATVGQTALPNNHRGDKQREGLIFRYGASEMIGGKSWGLPFPWVHQLRCQAGAST